MNVSASNMFINDIIIVNDLQVTMKHIHAILWMPTENGLAALITLILIYYIM